MSSIMEAGGRAPWADHPLPEWFLDQVRGVVFIAFGAGVNLAELEDWEVELAHNGRSEKLREYLDDLFGAATAIMFAINKQHEWRMNAGHHDQFIEHQPVSRESSVCQIPEYILERIRYGLWVLHNGCPEEEEDKERVIHYDTYKWTWGVLFHALEVAHILAQIRALHKIREEANK